MRILSIETSCDETAISIVEATGGITSPSFSVLGNSLFSQIELHKKFGGVYPMLAKREHAKNLVPLLLNVLNENLVRHTSNTYTGSEETDWNNIESILSKEDGLYMDFRNNLELVPRPDIDVISVTSGPGLEPALWVGISFAEALGLFWNIPVIGVNHMEGHIASVLAQSIDTRGVVFPTLALLISGGHTELVSIESWGNYKVIGETRDDAVGEAFDKTARMLGLTYPGGPEISRLAEYARDHNIPKKSSLPRPMIHSHDLNFSFSGLKTAVLYYLRDTYPTLNGLETPLNDADRADICREFEDSVVDVLLKKTQAALIETGAKTLIIAGGVISNKKIRSEFVQLEQKLNGLCVKIPDNKLATDNAVMIACAAYINICINPEILKSKNKIVAKGNMKLQSIF